MATTPSQESLDKLQSQQVIWFCSVRPDGRPHLVPIWFVWVGGWIYVSTDPKSVKSRNIRANAAGDPGPGRWNAPADL